MLSPKLEFDNGGSAGTCVFDLSAPKNLDGVALSYHLNKTIVLVGLMGAGKTAVGTLVAQKLGVPFLDSDHEIEKAANMTVAEIFTRDGEPFFRAKESQVLQRLLVGKPCILSTGGGAYMASENREMIAKSGVALWLRADFELLWARVRHKDSRPLLRTPNPRQTLTDLFEKRTPIYAQAEITVDSLAGLSLEDMAHKVIETLLAHPESGVTKGAR